MKLICFGDSWTAGHGIETDSKYKEVAYPEKFITNLRNQNSWPRWVAQKLGCLYVNCGVCGYGNEYILKEVEESFNSGFIEPNDIIIVMFSYPYRYTADTYNVVEIYTKLESILQNHIHFYFNSFYPTFLNEDFDVGQLPKYFINPQECLSDVLNFYEKSNDISVWEYNSRKVWDDKENMFKGDYHPNELGYRIIGDYIYHKIQEFL
jgi:hypothetical protein